MDTLTELEIKTPRVKSGLATRQEVVNEPEFQERLRLIQAVIEEGSLEYVYFCFVSVDGRMNGLEVPAHHFERMAVSGIRKPFGASLDFRRIRGRRRIAFGPEDGDMLAIPDLSTFRVLPWDKAVGLVYCNLYYRHGVPFDVDVRSNLQRVTALLEEELGCTLMIGVEPEVMYLKLDDNGKAVGASQMAGRHIKKFEILRPIIVDILAGCREMGIDTIQGCHESGPGQLEINIMYGDPLTTADNHTTFRLLTHTVANKHGLQTCFMPKPFIGMSGNGYHHHFSLLNGEGENVFKGSGSFGLSQTALYFLGGILKHSPALTAICAPTVNSYKRFWDGYLAPTYISWGLDNRTCFVRSPEPGRLEFRLPDSSCNLYLSIAALQLAGLDGIRNRLDPGEPVQENVYELVAKGVEIPKVPMTLLHALEAFEEDDLMHEILPGTLYQAFVGCRRDDWESYCAAVTDWEFERYSDLFP